MLTPSLMRRGAYALPRQSQRGVMIIEALVAIMLLMLGIMGIAGLTTKSTALTGQAQYRTEAGMFAEQIIQSISLSVDRSSDSKLATSLKGFEHQPTESEACSFAGSAMPEDSAPAQILKAARNGVTGVAGLPGAVGAGQQVVVDTDNNDQVTVTLCWQGPNDDGPRTYQIQAFVH